MHLNDKDRKALEEAYKATRYEVFLERSIAVIRVGEKSNAVDDLCNEQSVSSWAFITAHNPLSRPLSNDDNRHRQQLLRSLLIAGKFTYYTGKGIGDAGDWPAEPSFLVLGMNKDKALAYGQVFDQHAIVYGKCGGFAQLLFCFSR